MTYSKNFKKLAAVVAITTSFLGSGLYYQQPIIPLSVAAASEQNVQNTVLSKEAVKKSHIIKLQGQAKQDYVKSKLDAVFHPQLGQKNIPMPFTPPQGYTYIKGVMDGVKYEQLTPVKKKTDRVLIQMHGGGYVNDLRDGHRNLGARQSALAGGAEVFYLDYRVAPKNHHPAALEDAVRLYTGLLAKGYSPNKIAFIGDSAGGNLVLTTALYLRDKKIPLPKALIMISPWGTLENTLPSRVYNYEQDFCLGKDASPLASDIVHARYAEGSNIQDPYLSPVYADTFKDLPSMLIQSGSKEVLLDDSYIIAGKALADGVKVQFTNYEGMPHDFALMLPHLQDSVDSWNEIKDFINKTM